MPLTPADRAWHYRLINACITTEYIQSGPSGDVISDSPEAQGFYEKVGFLDKPICFQRTSPCDNGQTDCPCRDVKINAGLVGRTTGDRIVVAFRGTLSPPEVSDAVACCDWTQSGKFDPISWRVGSTDYGKVCRGFGTAAERVRFDVTGAILRIISQTPAQSPIREIWVTGHSKGGAMALLLAPHINLEAANLSSQSGVRPVTNVVTFAAPCTADAAFRASYSGPPYHLVNRTVRYQNQYDVVPLAPKRLPIIPPTFLPDCPDVHQPVPERSEYDQMGTLHYISGSGPYGNIAPYAIETDQTLAEDGYSQSTTPFPPPSPKPLFAHQPKGNYLNCFYGNG